MGIIPPGVNVPSVVTRLIVSPTFTFSLAATSLPRSMPGGPSSVASRRGLRT